MASKESKRKYDKEKEVSTATSKKQRAFGDYNGDTSSSSSSSSEEVSSEEEPAR
jgi:hypothetical protein